MDLYTVETGGALEKGLELEWLLTNGLGGFASSSVVGCNRRRYHALLCAATMPPVGRIVALSKVGELLHPHADRPEFVELSVNHFRDSLHPRGDRYLQRFALGDVARWEFAAEEIRITKQVQLLWHRNVVGVRYTIEAPAGRQFLLRLLPFVALRDFHALRRADGSHFQVTCDSRQVCVTDGRNSLYIQADGAEFGAKHEWWYGLTYPIERERGLDDAEDLFIPGSFLHRGTGSGAVTLWAGTDPVGVYDWQEQLGQRPRRAVSFRRGDGTLLPQAMGEAPTLRRLARAASDFIVRRTRPDGRSGTSIIAGYPWFSDWGRDTMIALPGLLLTTGRFEEAAEVLAVFAQYVSEGMIPNHFDDYTNQPHYNTADASLWFIHAAFAYRRYSGDETTFAELLRPACVEIFRGYRNGTRFNIAMDEQDGLIWAGSPGSQLTWMDAKCDGVVFTPRHGKAVEINALWYNALKLLGEEHLAAKVAAGFAAKFWISPFRGLADVVRDGERDVSLRPNQILAVSLPHSPLSAAQQSAVVEVVRRELLTPYGLRTLEVANPHFKAHYSGQAFDRDAAYHNGTIWAWLMGPFIEAYLKVNNRAPIALEQARQWLRPLIDHLEQGCLGQISEIFEAAPPHRPVGCFAQAWSVAEVLRMAVEVGL